MNNQNGTCKLHVREGLSIFCVQCLVSIPQAKLAEYLPKNPSSKISKRIVPGDKTQTCNLLHIKYDFIVDHALFCFLNPNPLEKRVCQINKYNLSYNFLNATQHHYYITASQFHRTKKTDFTV